MKCMMGFLLSTTVLLSVVHANAAEIVKIGAVYALTGAGAVAGGDGIRGTELAIAEANAAGGLKNHGGAQIELVKGDSQSKPVNAVGETERLIADQRQLEMDVVDHADRRRLCHRHFPLARHGPSARSEIDQGRRAVSRQ
jgi:hypothetical protein